jgi:hypothetical protein
MAAVMLPYTATFLAFVTVGIAVIGRTAWALTGGVLVLLTLLRMAPTEWTSSRPAPAEDDLVIITFNVPRFGETAEGLARDVLDLMARERPHVAALQGPAAWRRTEIPRTPGVADYVRPVIDSLGYVLTVPVELPERGIPQPVLTRRDASGPLVIGPAQTTSLGPEQDPQASVYVRTQLRWQGRELVLYNLHLRGFGADKPWEDSRFPLLEPRAWKPFLSRYRAAYRRRADEVGALMERIEAETLPVIIAGDLNATSDNWTYRQLARGRTDAFRAVGRGWGGTYRSDHPLVRIDFVLADLDFEVVAASVPDVRFSYHRPVVVRLRWRDGADANDDSG